MHNRLFSTFFALSVLFAVPAAAQGARPADDPQTVNAAAVQGSPQETHPTPAHTGWASLAKDTARDFVAFPKRKSTWVLLGAGAAGALLAHQGDGYVQTHIVNNRTADRFFAPGKVIGSSYVQIGASVGMWVVGRYVVPPVKGASRTNKWSHIGFDLMRAQIVSQALTQAMKVTVRRDRPTGECCAFPSGHASTAFATAAVLERHFGYRGSWPAVLGASYVAASRLVDNRHFLSDVVFGAALGTASGWTVVGVHGRDTFALQPVPVRGGVMIALVRKHE